MKTNSILPAGIALLSLCVSATAAPVKTVPWNGHKGAITFTFDDAYISQLKYVVPALDKRGIHATFFMIGSSWGENREAWIEIARKGHELGNHTLTHASLGGLDSVGLENEISGMADTLRAADPSIQAITLAYPYCATNELIDRIADRQNIVARTCGWDPRWNPRYGWFEPPTKWMEANSFGITDTATVRQALTEIDRADSAGSWFVTLNHGIMDNSYGPISDTAVEAMFDRALAHDLWIGTYQEIAAYWRAAQVMDTVTVKASATGWALSWASPHPKMPRQVALRVQLDSAVFGAVPTVTQNGTVIAREADGSYVIDFMQKALSVAKAGSTGIARSASDAGAARLVRSGETLRVEGLHTGSYRWSLRNLAGQSLGNGGLSVAGDQGTMLLPHVPSGALLLVLRSEAGGLCALPVPAGL